MTTISRALVIRALQGLLSCDDHELLRSQLGRDPLLESILLPTWTTSASGRVTPLAASLVGSMELWNLSIAAKPNNDNSRTGTLSKSGSPSFDIVLWKTEDGSGTKLTFPAGKPNSELLDLVRCKFVSVGWASAELQLSLGEKVIQRDLKDRHDSTSWMNWLLSASDESSSGRLESRVVSLETHNLASPVLRRYSDKAKEKSGEALVSGPDGQELRAAMTLVRLAKEQTHRDSTKERALINVVLAHTQPTKSGDGNPSLAIELRLLNPQGHAIGVRQIQLAAWRVEDSENTFEIEWDGNQSDVLVHVAIHAPEQGDLDELADDLHQLVSGASRIDSFPITRSAPTDPIVARLAEIETDDREGVTRYRCFVLIRSEGQPPRETDTAEMPAPQDSWEGAKTIPTKSNTPFLRNVSDMNRLLDIATNDPRLLPLIARRFAGWVEATTCYNCEELISEVSERLAHELEREQVAGQPVKLGELRALLDDRGIDPKQTRSWLQETATHRVIDWLRRPKHRRLTSIDGCEESRADGQRRLSRQFAAAKLPEPVAREIAPGESIQREDLYTAIVDCMQQLGEAQRECLLLHTLGEMSNDEVASYNGSKPATVRANVCRGVDKVRRLLLEKLGQDTVEELIEAPTLLRQIRDAQGQSQASSTLPRQSDRAG